MARVNINSLGISEPKVTGMDKLNSDDHYIYFRGRESLRRNGIALIVNKSLKYSTWVQSQKWQKDLCSVWGNITVIQVYAPTSNAEEAEVEQFYEDLQDLLELTHKKRYPFHHRGLECKSRKSRDTWINRQDWPWTTKWSSTKANRFLPRKCTGHSKCPFQQHKRRFYTWTSPDGQHQNQIDYIICTQRWRSAIETG